MKTISKILEEYALSAYDSENMRKAFQEYTAQFLKKDALELFNEWLPKDGDKILLEPVWEKISDLLKQSSLSLIEEIKIYDFILWMDKYGWLQNAQEGCLFNDGFGNNFAFEDIWKFYVKEQTQTYIKEEATITCDKNASPKLKQALGEMINLAFKMPDKEEERVSNDRELI